MEYLESAKLLTYGILKRFLLWAPALILNPFDVNKKLVQPVLPDAWKFDLPWSPDWAVVVLICLIFWAAICTFNEHRSHTKPRPNWNVNDVLGYILKESKMLSRRAASDRLINEIEVELRDAARDGRIKVWGRPYDTKISGAPATEREIPQEHWDNYTYQILPIYQTGVTGNMFASIVFMRPQIIEI